MFHLEITANFIHYFQSYDLEDIEFLEYNEDKHKKSNHSIE